MKGGSAAITVNGAGRMKGEAMTTYDLFNGLPPHSNATTSRAAAVAIQPHVSRLADKVFRVLQSAPMACWQVEDILDMDHTTCSARIRELVLKGIVRDSGRRTKTPSGRAAIVWAVA